MQPWSTALVTLYRDLYLPTSEPPLKKGTLVLLLEFFHSHFLPLYSFQQQFKTEKVLSFFHPLFFTVHFHRFICFTIESTNNSLFSSSLTSVHHLPFSSHSSFLYSVNLSFHNISSSFTHSFLHSYTHSSLTIYSFFHLSHKSQTKKWFSLLVLSDIFLRDGLTLRL